MSLFNEVNREQKEAMAMYMRDHPDLAKNLISNCSQGKIRANELWQDLSDKLNFLGPPIKDVKSWREVFADQKYAAKSKPCFNENFGGGPYVDIPFSLAEKHVVEAAGLEEEDDGLSRSSHLSHNSESGSMNQKEEATCSLKRTTLKVPPPTNTVEVANDHQQKKQATQEGILAVLQSILKIKEKEFAMKSAKFIVDMEIKRIELEIKKKELNLFNIYINDIP